MTRGNDRVRGFVKGLVKDLMGSGLGLGMLFGGFWLLYLGFLRPNPFLGLLGGGTILLGMTILVRVRRGR